VPSSPSPSNIPTAAPKDSDKAGGKDKGKDTGKDKDQGKNKGSDKGDGKDKEKDKDTRSKPSEQDKKASPAPASPAPVQKPTTAPASPAPVQKPPVVSNYKLCDKSLQTNGCCGGKGFDAKASACQCLDFNGRWARSDCDCSRCDKYGHQHQQLPCPASITFTARWLQCDVA
jgi:hypothetical protein